MKAIFSAIVTWLWLAESGVAAPAPAPAPALVTTARPRARSPLQRRIDWPPLQNGGFESGKLQPWAPQGYGSQGLPRTPAKIVSPGYNSSRYALQVQPVTQFQSGIVAQTFYEPPNTNYTISLMYKVVASADPSTCTVEMRGSDDYHDDPADVTTVGAPMAVGDWTALTMAYANWNPAYWGQIDLELMLNCANGTVLFDDVTIEPMGTLEPPSCAGNAVVPNGDWESGTTAPWRFANGEAQYASIVSPGANGSAHALAIAFPNGTALASTWFAEAVPDVCFNYDYTFEFDLNWVGYGPVPSTPSANACQFQATVEYCNQDDLFAVVWPTAPGWRHYSFPCLATRDWVQPELSVVCNDQAPASNWSVQLDNIALNYAGGPAPTPSISSGPASTPTPTHGAAGGGRREVDVTRPRWA